LGRGHTKLRRRLGYPDQKASAGAELKRTSAEALLVFPFRDSLGNKPLHHGRGYAQVRQAFGYGPLGGIRTLGQLRSSQTVDQCLGAVSTIVQVVSQLFRGVDRHIDSSLVTLGRDVTPTQSSPAVSTSHRTRRG